MARRGRRAKGIEGFAEDLGRLLGSAQSKAQGWLGQRQMIAKQLAQIRDTASDLLSQMAGRRAARRAAVARAVGERLRKRRLSPAARKAISDAQKRRWAAVRAAKASKKEPSRK
jgi:hypothetical protein